MSISTPADTASADATVAGGRRLLAVRVVAVAFALVTALASFGLPSLVMSWFTTGDELAFRTSYVVYGALAGVLVPGLALALVRQRAVAAWQASAALVVATVVALGQAFEPENLEYSLYTVGPFVLLLALHPVAREALAGLRAVGGRVDLATLAVVGVAAVPAVIASIAMASESRATSYLHEMHGKYLHGAVLVLALLLIAAVTALRSHGHRTVVALVASCTALYGLAGVLFPADPMSPGAAWGTAAVAVAAAYAVAGMRRHSLL